MSTDDETDSDSGTQSYGLTASDAPRANSPDSDGANLNADFGKYHIWSDVRGDARRCEYTPETFPRLMLENGVIDVFFTNRQRIFGEASRYEWRATMHLLFRLPGPTRLIRFQCSNRWTFEHWIWETPRISRVSIRPYRQTARTHYEDVLECVLEWSHESSAFNVYSDTEKMLVHMFDGTNRPAGLRWDAFALDLLKTHVICLPANGYGMSLTSSQAQLAIPDGDGAVVPAPLSDSRELAMLAERVRIAICSHDDSSIDRLLRDARVATRPSTRGLCRFACRSFRAAFVEKHEAAVDAILRARRSWDWDGLLLRLVRDDVPFLYSKNVMDRIVRPNAFSRQILRSVPGECRTGAQCAEWVKWLHETHGLPLVDDLFCELVEHGHYAALRYAARTGPAWTTTEVRQRALRFVADSRALIRKPKSWRAFLAAARCLSFLAASLASCVGGPLSVLTARQARRLRRRLDSLLVYSDRDEVLDAVLDAFERFGLQVSSKSVDRFLNRRFLEFHGNRRMFLSLARRAPSAVLDSSIHSSIRSSHRDTARAACKVAAAHAACVLPPSGPSLPASIIAHMRARVEQGLDALVDPKDVEPNRCAGLANTLARLQISGTIRRLSAAQAVIQTCWLRFSYAPIAGRPGFERWRAERAAEWSDKRPRLFPPPGAGA